MNSPLKSLAVLGSIGFFFVIVLGICIFIGHQADVYLELGNKGKLVGIIIGFPVGIYSTYRQLKNLLKT